MSDTPTAARDCVKIGYPNAARAAKALTAAKKRSKGVTLYRYQCEECGQWHLTRVDPTKMRRRKEARTHHE